MQLALVSQMKFMAQTKQILTQTLVNQAVQILSE